MRVLIACEYSGVVREAFAKLGHDAWSCDILPSDFPGKHIQDDVLNHLEDGWDLMIAHPPCTFLCNSGVCHLYTDKGRFKKMQEGALFFKKLLDAPIPMIAVENPIMHKYAVEIIGRRQDQVIQPFMFGHPERKATCLWLKNLPLLKPTKSVQKEMESLPKSKSQRIHYTSPGKDRWKIRSKTFEGIANAMATQWGTVGGFTKSLRDFPTENIIMDIRFVPLHSLTQRLLRNPSHILILNKILELSSKQGATYNEEKIFTRKFVCK